MTEQLYRACCALSCALLGRVVAHPVCRARQSASVVRSVPYHDKLAARAVSVSCHDTNTPVATLYLLTMTELCRNLRFSCCDLVSTAYTSLYPDKEKSYRDMKFLVASALCFLSRHEVPCCLCPLSQHGISFHARSLSRH